MSIEIKWKGVLNRYAVSNINGGVIFLRGKHEIIDGYYRCVSGKGIGYSVDSWSYHERPLKETKPVYTQSMYDSGEKIEVGMEFSFGGKIQNNGPYIAIGISKTSKGDDVLTYEYGACSIDTCWINGTWVKPWVKPIDTRTDKEKTNDALDEFYQKKETWTHMNLLEAVILGHIPDLKYTGNK